MNHSIGQSVRTASSSVSPPNAVTNVPSDGVKCPDALQVPLSYILHTF
jgi:hypothetical protein